MSELQVDIQRCYCCELPELVVLTLAKCDAEIERLRAALLAWYEASDEEERRWAMELTVPLVKTLRGAGEKP